MNENREARKYILIGRVQGVGFRWFVREQAQEIGVAGWVKNLPDGSVEAAAEGTPPQLDRFESILRQGPPSARVEGVEVEEVGGVGGDGFEIRR